MENDSTALKPAIQYDKKQEINVGLKDRADIVFVASNPDPKPEFLKENIVSEANVFTFPPPITTWRCPRQERVERK